MQKKQVSDAQSTEETESDAGDKNELKKTRDKEKRDGERFASVQAGVAELNLFLKDLVRAGLLNLPGKGASFFEKTAARMIDAKAPGLAAFVKTFNKLPYFETPLWHREALALNARIWLLLESFQHIEQLPQPVQEDVRTLIGWTKKRQALLDDPLTEVVTDHWLVAGKQVVLEDDLIEMRHWLYGCTTHRTALLLDFAYKTNPLEPPVLVGSVVKAELAYFPSNLPNRAILKTQEAPRRWGDESYKLPAVPNWKAAKKQLADRLSRFPWADDALLYVDNLSPLIEESKWYLRDAENRQVSIPAAFEAVKSWRLLALTGAHPTPMFVRMTHGEVLPLGVFTEGEYVLLDG
jgi:hypothetical protein